MQNVFRYLFSYNHNGLTLKVSFLSQSLKWTHSVGFFFECLCVWWDKKRRWEEPVITYQDNQMCEKRGFSNHYSLLLMYKLFVYLVTPQSSIISHENSCIHVGKI